MTPTRANIRRCWRASHGISSVGPWRSGWSPPVRKPGVEQRRDVARARPGRRRSGPSGVSTSTSGSSQSRPREPLRTIVTSSERSRAWMASDAATPSAPTERAAVSRGTKTRVVIGRWPRRRARPAAPRPSGRGRSSSIITGRPERAVAQAEDLVDGQAPVGGRAADRDPEPLDGVLDERVGADGLAGLGAADPQLDGPAGRRPEVAVEGDDAVDLGAREVQGLGDDRDGPRVDVAERRRGCRGGSAGAVRARRRGRPRSPGRGLRTTAHALCGLRRASSVPSRRSWEPRVPIRDPGVTRRSLPWRAGAPRPRRAGAGGSARSALLVVSSRARA